MAWWVSLWNGLLAILGFLWEQFLDWLWLFISPIPNVEMLWVIIPIWATFIITEIFQEKSFTDFGNAITNSVLPMWAAVDWTRFLVRNLRTGDLTFDMIVFFKFCVCLLVFGYGLSILLQGIKAKEFIHYYGRIREVSYVLLAFTPIVYGVVGLTWHILLAIILFAPAFYYAVEFLDRRIPDPVSVQRDKGSASPSSFDGLPPGF